VPAPIKRRPRKPPRRSSGRVLPGLLLVLLGILIGAGLFYLGCGDARPRGGEERKARSEAAPASAPEPGRPEGDRRPTETPDPAEAAEPAPEPVAPDAEPSPAPAPPDGARLAIVIDDLGRSTDDLAPLERLGVPITYAVLPFEEQTPEVVAALRRSGAEILLHLPMEPTGGLDPGPGALLFGMAEDELEDRTAAALAAVPGAAGVNNHMGSRLSADEPSMRAILGVLAARRLFFLDSRTSAQSVGYRVASSLGVPAAERQVFLDPDPRPEAIRAQFARLLGVARQRGSAIAIGHPLPETLEALAEEIPRAQAAGYQFVPVSYLLDNPTDLAAAE
jgi:polysaccharide deacetylase 2 family uncharacterized protein YibQ